MMNDIVTIDVGLKSEGRIPLSEFSRPGQKSEIQVGDETEVYIENVGTTPHVFFRRFELGLFNWFEILPRVHLDFPS